ncbi:hypothetical protein EYF80_032819 [Liparis tanakae]|uniref:Uncharacterized protein n=1 Tax=Liparis tanakae TaxID=230148 RepID=A0A4Z2GTT3_9TELE|nr:hypothetical protein EYF80_032819 [Liparis tanakae]
MWRHLVVSSQIATNRSLLPFLLTSLAANLERRMDRVICHCNGLEAKGLKCGRFSGHRISCIGGMCWLYVDWAFRY